MMEVRFDEKTEAALNRYAAANDSDASEYVAQLVRSYLEHDAWFRASVQVGVAEAKRGNLIDQEEVRKILDRRFPG